MDEQRPKIVNSPKEEERGREAHLTSWPKQYYARIIEIVDNGREDK